MVVLLTQKDQEVSNPTNPANLISDAPPPAYDDLISSQNSPAFASLGHGGEKGRSTDSIVGIGPDGRRASSSHSPQSTHVSQSQAKAMTRSIGINKNWFSWFSEKDTRKEVKQTIQSLIKDVIKDPKSPTAACVLRSCFEACQSKGLSFQSIISEKFLEGHCPIYWAIAKRTSTSKTLSSGSETEDSNLPDDSVELLDILLSMPLNPTTRLEAYSACLLTSDNALFQRLRSVPDEQAINSGAGSVISADELLLGETPGDKIQVFDGDADYGEFRIIWDVAHFQKRMRAIGNVSTQVVARGHIWLLSFVILQKDNYHNGSVIKAGTWIICVSLVEPSPPTYLYAQVRISEPALSDSKHRQQRRSSTLTSDEPGESPKGGNALSMPKIGRKSLWPNTSKPGVGTNGGGNGGGSKSPIVLSLKTDSAALDDLLEPIQLSSLKDLSSSLPFIRRKSLSVALDRHQNGYSLQFDGSSYFNDKGTLRVIFEASLSKRNSGNDCVIC